MNQTVPFAPCPSCGNVRTAPACDMPGCGYDPDCPVQKAMRHGWEWRVDLKTGAGFLWLRRRGRLFKIPTVRG